MPCSCVHLNHHTLPIKALFIWETEANMPLGWMELDKHVWVLCYVLYWTPLHMSAFFVECKKEWLIWVLSLSVISQGLFRERKKMTMYYWTWPWLNGKLNSLSRHIFYTDFFSYKKFEIRVEPRVLEPWRHHIDKLLNFWASLSLDFLLKTYYYRKKKHCNTCWVWGYFCMRCMLARHGFAAAWSHVRSF